MKLTVVICTHNRSALLMQTISSFNQANLANNLSINILVIPNACTDKTVHQLENYTANHSNNCLAISFSEEPRAGKSYALNHAINMTDSDYLCFVDDDQRVEKDFFIAIDSAISQFPEATIFCGQLTPDWTGLEPDWIHVKGNYQIYPIPIPDFTLGLKPKRITHETGHPSGGNLIIKKEVFSRIGCFSTALGPKGHNLAGGEDSDFVIRALNASEFIQYIPNIIQYHYVELARLKLPYLIKNSFQRTRSFVSVNQPMHTAVPLYMWRKLFNYILGSLFSFNKIKIRFYLMRIASTCGEIIGLIEKRNL